MRYRSAQQGRTATVFASWLSQVLLFTILCVLAYVGVQQVWRMSANDPQLQIAQDIAAQVAEGAQPQTITLPGNTNVEIGKSLAAFAILYDTGGKVLTSTATLAGEVPVLPEGVLEAARRAGEDRLTWQPAPGVRIAAVVEPADSGSKGFVLVGRSLSEVEKRTDDWGKIVLIAWGFGLVASLVVTGISAALTLKPSNTSA